jgi:hypothetical protein
MSSDEEFLVTTIVLAVLIFGSLSLVAHVANSTRLHRMAHSNRRQRRQH